MVNIKKEGIIFGKTALGFENEGVLNPAVIQREDGIHVFYRAVAKGNYSSIGYCLLSGPLEISHRNDAPLLYPQLPAEVHGIEDPRIVEIEGIFYLTYTAYDGFNALGALALSTDLKNFEKQGIIVPQIPYIEFQHLTSVKHGLNEKYSRYNQPWTAPDRIGEPNLLWDKNVIFFPRKIKNKFCFLHRIRPDIQLVSVDEIKDLTQEFWQEYLMHFEEHIVLAPKYAHEISYIGGGCPPIETKDGWLLIYHGVQDSVEGYIYSACAALLDLEDPRIELSRLPYALIKPEMHWELEGEVNNVCFPTGTAIIGDQLYVYYGAADEQIACASLSLSELMNELLSLSNCKTT